MKKGDRVFAVVCLVLGVWMVLESFQLDYKTGFTPGPGFEPFWLGVALALFSISLLIETYRRKNDPIDDPSRLPDRLSLARVGVIILMLAGFGVLMNLIGFILTVIIFIALLLFVLEKEDAAKSLGYAIGYGCFVFLVFRYWMKVDLPKGWFGL